MNLPIVFPNSQQHELLSNHQLRKTVMKKFNEMYGSWALVWLGLTELAWISYWLLTGADSTQVFVGIVSAWIVAMLCSNSVMSCLAADGRNVCFPANSM